MAMRVYSNFYNPYISDQSSYVYESYWSNDGADIRSDVLSWKKPDVDVRSLLPTVGNESINLLSINLLIS